MSDKPLASTEVGKLIDDIRRQMQANDYNTKSVHPERDALAMKIGHSTEMGLIHIEELLRKIEAVMGLPINDDMSRVLSSKAADFSDREPL